MRIAQGIEMLELPANATGRLFHPTVLIDKSSLVLVDTGMPGHYERIMGLIGEAGLSADDLKTIVLTHQDIDHIGGLPQFIEAAKAAGSRLEVYAHEADIPYINGDKPSIKVPQERIDAILGQLPEEIAGQYRSIMSPGSPNKVDHTLTDGQELPFGGGITVIHTPGHTPGHVSLYHKPSRTLIAGDAMVVQEGRLMGPAPANTPDLKLAMRSLGKLTAYDIETVICYHGGIYKDRPNERIAELAAQASED
jgi:glyoxylase-like metal-dependent hydrolase (beta-lactamase superfamily II)